MISLKAKNFFLKDKEIEHEYLDDNNDDSSEENTETIDLYEEINDETSEKLNSYEQYLLNGDILIEEIIF